MHHLDLHPRMPVSHPLMHLTSQSGPKFWLAYSLIIRKYDRAPKYPIYHYRPTEDDMPVIRFPQLGANLSMLAEMWGADCIAHLGGRRFLASRPSGGFLRLLVDEGIGSIEGDPGFDEAWECAKT